VAKDNLVLAVGRLLDPAKQVNLLTQQTHPVPVCIVGDSDEAAEPVFRAPVRAEVKFSDGDAGVSLKGPQSEAEIRLLYSRAALYAGTYRYDPSGMAVLEAALSRCTLILNDIPSLRELWGPAAVYFRTNESESLAEAVRILTADVQLRRNFANRAFQRARECFNAHRMTDNYIQLYRSVASQKISVAA
jgi:glycosyltransferase involved in cell wall biosynthesis